MQTDGHRCNDVCVWTNWNGDDDEKYIPQIIEKCSHTKNNNQCHRNPNSTDHESIIIIIICARWIVNHDALFRIEFGKMKTQHTTTERNREKETQTYTVTQSHGRRNFHAVFKLQKVHTHTRSQGDILVWIQTIVDFIDRNYWFQLPTNSGYLSMFNDHSSIRSKSIRFRRHIKKKIFFA